MMYGYGYGYRSFGGLRAFTPASLSGLHTWLDFSDAAALLINTGKVETAYDKSGNGNHFTQADSAKRPVLTASYRNGLSAATLAGGQGLAKANFSIGTFTCFFVVRSTVNNKYLWSHGSSCLYCGSLYASYVNRPAVNAAFTASLADWASDSTFQVVRQRFGGTSATHKLSRNALSVSGSTGGAGTDLTSVIANCSIGSNVGVTADFMSGEIAEVIFYDRDLTDAECFAVETYMANKWAMIATPEMFTRLFDFDASKGITLNGLTVSDWADQSGNSRHVAQANPTYQPTYTAAWRNGKPAILFEGNALPKFMQSAQFGPIAVPYTLLLVTQWTDTPSTGGNTALNASDVSPVFVASAGVCIHYFTSTPMYVTSGDQAYFDRAPSSFLDPHLLAYNVGSPATCYHNGRSMVKTSGAGLMTRAMNRVQLGAFRDDLSTPYSGYIARVCGLSDERSADEMARLAFHMNREYAI